LGSQDYSTVGGIAEGLCSNYHDQYGREDQSTTFLMGYKNMAHQHSGNVIMVCSDCAPKSGSFTGQDPKSFIGKLVKIAFKATKPDGKQTREHMWVEVREAPALDWLKGILLNRPYFQTGFDNGDSVGFRVDEIEDVKDMTHELKGN
jgi:Uncharacterized protein conserved in bacteria (DUF2314)